MSSSRLNVLEVLKQLPRTNCRECRLPSCMAFANQVALGQREPAECPYLDPAGLTRVRGLASDPRGPGAEEEERLVELRARITSVDLAAAAPAAGGELQGEELAVTCLGRPFLVDATGSLRSQCHANFWVLIPLLDYVINAASGPAPEPTGTWIKYDQLSKAMSRSDYFSTSCEGALCRLVDDHPELFPELLDLFGVESVDHGFDADLSVLLRPLPRVPLLVCYWKPEPPFASKLSIYFDRCTDHYLGIEATTILVMGIVEMLKRLVTRHTFSTSSAREP